ncbi:MAG TPA: phosphoserine phosphatase SerB [Xanthobacteraceae bacterium]|nr:phosphoserine phosphatase SerB [Xanthobacteraceae bacterium]
MPEPLAAVAILIAAPHRPALTPEVLKAAAAVLPGAAEPRLLAPGIAAEIAFAGGVTADAVRRALAPAPLDVAVLPFANRRKRLLLADMDSTMIGQECIDELADYAGVKAHVAAITERAMRGEIAFEPALRERVALLRGMPVAVVEAVIAERIRLTAGGPELVRTMRANGATAVLVSGGFTLFTGPIGRRIGFDADRANTLLVEDDRFTGMVAEPILGRQAKLDALMELRTALELNHGDTLAVGDGANDLAMLGEAGLGVAFHAKPQVASAAQISIEHGDLTALLYLQGYAQDEFVAG